MRNETGVVLMKATPAMPVFTMGWKELPEPGEIVVQEKREEPIYSLEEQNRLYRAALNDTNVMQVPLLIKGTGIKLIHRVMIFECVYNVVSKCDHFLGSVFN